VPPFSKVVTARYLPSGLSSVSPAPSIRRAQVLRWARTSSTWTRWKSHTAAATDPSELSEGPTTQPGPANVANRTLVNDGSQMLRPPVVAARRERRPVAAERHVLDVSVVCLEGSNQRSGRDVPDVDAPYVLAGFGDEDAARTHVDGNRYAAKSFASLEAAIVRCSACSARAAQSRQRSGFR
jgi:hypothetical protein